MITCRECKAQNIEGALFCSECGGFILGFEPNSTAVLPFSSTGHRLPPARLETQDLETTQGVQKITIVIPSNRQRLQLEFEGEMRIGRSDPETGLFPELDLTNFEGADRGVSRLHATIQATNQGIVLTDLNSTNGTLLNLYRLPPQKSFLVRNGDEVRFGDLLIHIFFDQGETL